MMTARVTCVVLFRRYCDGRVFWLVGWLVRSFVTPVVSSGKIVGPKKSDRFMLSIRAKMLTLTFENVRVNVRASFVLRTAMAICNTGRTLTKFNIDALTQTQLGCQLIYRSVYRGGAFGF